MSARFTVVLDTGSAHEEVTFTAADIADFEDALRAQHQLAPLDEPGGTTVARFELYDEDLEEWFVPAALTDVPDHTCRARISKCDADVPTSPGSQEEGESTQQEVVRQRLHSIAQLRGRLETLSSALPASPRSTAPEANLPEGVPPSAQRTDEDFSAAQPADGREEALARVQHKRAALLEQTENEEEATAKLRLVQAVEDWLTEEVGIGGNQAGGGANRGFDPTALVQFAWEHMLEDHSPDDMYRRFVEAQQVQAQQALWLQVMQGTELHNLSTMPAIDVEQFALKSGPLEHETRKNTWSKIYAILWRDPAIAIDDTRELGLLLYPDEDSSAPSMVVQLCVGQFAVAPPKTKRQTWSSVFRIDAGRLKLILGAATQEERADWTDCLLLTESVRQRLRTTVSREETIAAEQQRLDAQETSRSELSARMSESGPINTLKVTTAQELSSCRPEKEGWVRREGRQNVFTRTWCVLWQDNGCGHEPHAAEAQVEIGPCAWLLFFESPSSSKPTDFFCLSPASPTTQDGKSERQVVVEIGTTKKPRSNCEHCLRMDGRAAQGSGGGTWKVVFGTDDADDLSQWRTLLEQVVRLHGTATGQTAPSGSATEAAA